jgi:hypothetical protein
MGLWVFGPVADSPLALPAVVIAAFMALIGGKDSLVRLSGAVGIAAVTFALGWLAFTGSRANPGRLPIFVEPAIGAAGSAVAAVLVLSTLRTGRPARSRLSVLPALTAVALLATHRLVMTAGPVSAFSHMTGGDLLAAYEKHGAYEASANLVASLRITSMIGGLPVLFLSVLLAVERHPLSKCVSLCVRGFARRRSAWLCCLLVLGVVAFAIFLFATRLIWASVLGERTSSNVAFLGVILTIFTGFAMGIYVYFAARTVLVLTDDPSLGPEVPVFPRRTPPFPKRVRSGRRKRGGG